MRLEIDVQPFDSALFCRFRREAYQLKPDSAPPEVPVDRRVQNKSVLGAVPCDINKADQTLHVISAYKKQAMLQDKKKIPCFMIFPGICKQSVELVVGHLGAYLINNVELIHIKN